MEPGKVIRDRYRLIEVAGRGGMAVVWRAIMYGDLGFERTVAVKQMHPTLAENPLYVEMFAEEARVGVNMNSPNVAQIYDFLSFEGQYYLVMEWVEGIDVGGFIRHHREADMATRWDLVTAIGIGLLRGLSAAHERKNGAGETAPVVHRDVSPHNILVTETGMVKLIDFGLSLARDRIKELTEPGVVKGKMSYLSPEIVSGKRPSVYSDIYASGSVLWETLVGRKLFEGRSDFEVYKKLRENQIQPLRPLRRDVPRSMVAVINRALATRENQRFPSAREMADELALVLRKGNARKDLHGLLAAKVREVREGLGMGRRTGEPSTTTPVANIEVEETKLPTQAAGEQLVEHDGDEKKRGLLHRLPFIGRRR